MLPSIIFWIWLRWLNKSYHVFNVLYLFTNIEIEITNCNNLRTLFQWSTHYVLWLFRYFCYFLFCTYNTSDENCNENKSKGTEEWDLLTCRINVKTKIYKHTCITIYYKDFVMYNNFSSYYRIFLISHLVKLKSLW